MVLNVDVLEPCKLFVFFLHFLKLICIYLSSFFLKSSFAKLFNSQQSSSKSFNLSTSMNTSQSTIQSMHNSISRLSTPNEFTISSSLSQINETNNPNTFMSIQKTTSDSDLNQYLTNWKISMKQTCIR